MSPSLDCAKRSHRLSALFFGLALMPASAALAAADTDGGRGEMLYSTHCIACHTSQVHWRDKRLATDWSTLENQVRRWQRNTGLSWTEEDIASVTRHLNNVYYHFPASGQEKVISLSGPEADAASMSVLRPGGSPRWKSIQDRK